MATAKAGARKMRLTDAAITKLKPRSNEYTVWDSRVGGFGVRVRPSGHRGYVYHRKVDGRVSRITLGPASLRTVEEARRECLKIEVSASTARPDGQTCEAPTFAAFVNGPWRAACYARFKASTQRRTDIVLNNQLLPAFGAFALDRITRVEVNRWFDSYSRAAPGSANRALDVLRQIINHAVLRGCIATNPTRGVRRNPRPKLTRFLSRREIRRLHEVLGGYAVGSLSQRQQADIIRLLLLTGCRKGEIMGLRWREVKDDALHLEDSKTGPRRVFLNAEACGVIGRQPRKESAYVFPSPVNPQHPRRGDLTVWNSVRKKVGIEDVRLHDLRHTFASHAVMQGVPLPVVARLLGHKQLRMTLRYAHVGDSEIQTAAERIGETITALMEGESGKNGASGSAP